MITITIQIEPDKKITFLTTKEKVVQILESFKVNHPISKGDIIIDGLIKQIKES